MLHIHLRGYNSLSTYPNIINDVEEAFGRISLHGSNEEKTLLKVIEQADYYDEMSFIDRFGNKRSTQDLSTGCKASLVVLNNPDIWVDTKECGLNATSAIIGTCKNGKIVINDFQCKFITYNVDKNINVEFDNKIFTDYDTFNDYIDEV